MVFLVVIVETGLEVVDEVTKVHLLGFEKLFKIRLGPGCCIVG